MNILAILFGHPEIRHLPSDQKREVKQLLEDLVKIGEQDDYLSLTPGSPFNGRCHHIGARKIGERLNEVGGIELMRAARWHVKRKLKPVMAEHLDHCWKEIGEWKA
jgi:hypothetical protein